MDGSEPGDGGLERARTGQHRAHAPKNAPFTAGRPCRPCTTMCPPGNELMAHYPLYDQVPASGTL